MRDRLGARRRRLTALVLGIGACASDGVATVPLVSISNIPLGLRHPSHEPRFDCSARIPASCSNGTHPFLTPAPRSLRHDCRDTVVLLITTKHHMMDSPEPAFLNSLRILGRVSPFHYSVSDSVRLANTLIGLLINHLCRFDRRGSWNQNHS